MLFQHFVVLEFTEKIKTSILLDSELRYLVHPLNSTGLVFFGGKKETLLERNNFFVKRMLYILAVLF